MLLTYRYRVKDATAGKRLARMAVSVNQVWNYCGGIQNDSRRLNRRWPSEELGSCHSASPAKASPTMRPTRIA